MDRRRARRDVLAYLAVIEERWDALERLATEMDQVGDPIFAGELRRYLEKLTEWLDKMYVWAGNI